MADHYPKFSYYPKNVAAPGWVGALTATFHEVRKDIDTVRLPKGLSSDHVLRALRPGLIAMGFEVESGKHQSEKVLRPVLFGDEGRPRVMYEIDAFHDDYGIALEIEAGRGASNNADYRDIVRTALILKSRFLALATPIEYKFKNKGKETSIPAYKHTHDRLDAIYASQRLRLPFDGALIIGY